MGVPQPGNMDLLPVVQDVKFNKPRGLCAPACVVVHYLVTAGNNADAGDSGGIIAQNPLFAYGYTVKPLAVFPNVLVTMANSSLTSGASSGWGSWERMDWAKRLFAGKKASRKSVYPS